jgi:hypothetical protein
MHLNKVKSKKSGKTGFIQAEYPNQLYLFYNGEYYEHLKPDEIEQIIKHQKEASCLKTLKN